MKSAGSLCLILALSTPACVSTRSENSTVQRFEYQQPQMGVPFRIVLYAPDPTAASSASAVSFQRIKQLNDVMSDYDTDSELSRLSRASGQGREVPVSADLWRVLQRAQALAERSGGAFHVTVGPLVNLWRKARREHKMPDAIRLAQARQAVGYRHVRLDAERQAVELLVPDMRLDLGGIAKGYAVGEALRTLGRLGITRALVEGGGDVGVSAAPPDKKGWRFELAPLDVTNAPPAKFLLLKHQAISTSGDLNQRLEIDGKRYSHIVDPRTGIGLTDHSLVSVIAPDSITADSLTKVASVIGPEKAMRFIEDTPRVAARIMRNPLEDLEVYESKRFKRFYEKVQRPSSKNRNHENEPSKLH